MKNKHLKVFFTLCLLTIVCLSILMFTACNDTMAYSNEIFIDDFSETYTFSIKAKVKNHSILPEAGRAFEYSKGFDALYETIIEKRSSYSAYKVNDIIVVDETSNGRKYSCIIYPSGEKNKYIVHSMAYMLGDWANRLAIFFPAYALDKEISYLDEEDTVYQCSYKIDALAAYYSERGYYATIDENVLHVVCLLRYPSVFDYYTEKAISWSIVYDGESSIRFSDVANAYV